MEKKIGIIDYGFIDNYYDELVKLCRNNNIKVDLFTFYENSSKSYLADKTYILKTKYKPKDFQSKTDLELEIKKLVDINDYIYIIADVICLSFTLNIYHNHSLNKKIESSSGYLLGKILKLLHYKRLIQEKKYYKNCPKVVAVSNLVKKDIIKNYSLEQEKVKVIYPGTNNSNNSYDRQINKNLFIIGASACGFSTKGGYNILKTVIVLKRYFSGFKFKLKIINPNYKKNSILYYYLKIFGIDNLVEFLPYQEDINKFYSSIDCFICASRFDAFGRVVTEAMLAGVPVIVGSNIGASEIIDDGQNGFIFSYNKDRSINLAKKIIEVASRKKYLKEIIKNGKNTAKEINWKNFANSIFSVINKKVNSDYK